MDYSEIKESIRNLSLELLNVVSTSDHDYTSQPTNDYIISELENAKRSIERLIENLNYLTLKN